MIIIKYYAILLAFRAFGNFYGNAFIVSTGHAKIILIANLIGGILNIILDLILISYFGFIGVFISTIIIQLIVALYEITSYFRLMFRLNERSETQTCC